MQPNHPRPMHWEHDGMDGTEVLQVLYLCHQEMGLVLGSHLILAFLLGKHSFLCSISLFPMLLMLMLSPIGLHGMLLLCGMSKS